jgi:hypothetical protein
MNTSDLPVLPKSNWDVYKSVIDDVEEVLVNELYGRSWVNRLRLIFCDTIET